MRHDAVLITGASSGIGRAVALACAAPGRVLHLGGRDAARLEEVAAACRARGATAATRIVDVTDGAAMADWIEGAGRLDLVLASAGVSGGLSGTEGGSLAESADQVRRILAINVEGVINTVLPAASSMRRQVPDGHGVRGRIAAIASIAGFVSLPATPTYCASKAAVDRWLVGTGGNLREDGILLSSVACGFVRSPMTARNDFPMPGLMEADEAARRILAGLAAGRPRITFPWWLAAATRAVDLLPIPLTRPILMRNRSKPPLDETMPG